MTPNEQSNPPPADAIIFKLPAYYRPLLIVGVIVLVGFVALGLALPWVPGPGPSSSLSFLLAAVCLLFFGSLAFYTFRAFQRSRDQVAVNDDGIWYLPHKGRSTFIRWNQVATVKAHEFTGWLVIADIAGRKIRLEYRLKNFDRLREIVLRHTDSKRRRTPPPAVFRPLYLKMGFMAFVAIGFFCAAYFSAKQGALVPALGFIAFGVLGVFAFEREPRLLRISNQSITIEYPGWRRIIPYDAITNIDFDNIREYYFLLAIERRGAKPLSLTMYRGGSVALYDALRAAWLKARKDGVRSEAPEQIEETSGPLPTVFHSDSRLIVILGMVILLAVALNLFAWRLLLPKIGHRADLIMLGPLLGGLGLIFLMTRIPRSLMLSPDSLTVGYLGWQRIVPYETITNVEMTKRVGNSGKVVELVTVECRNGRTLKFGSLKEGVPTFHQTLRAAWSRSTGTPLATEAGKAS